MKLVFDIETDGLLDELTTIHCIEAVNEHGTRFSFKPGEIDKGIELLAMAEELIGHNIICFDIPAIKKVYPEWEPRGKIIDTLVLTRLFFGDIKNQDFEKYGAQAGEQPLPRKLFGSHSLKAWGYRINMHKDEIATDWQEWTPVMQKYCYQDVLVNEKLYTMLPIDDWSNESIELEHDAAEVCHRVGNNGWTFDMEKASSLYAEICRTRSDLEDELQTLFEPWTVSEWFTPKVNNKKLGYEKGVPFEKKKIIQFNPNSRRHIEHCLKQKYKWKPKQLTAGGHAQIDEVVLSQLDYPEAKKLASSFLLTKRAGQLAEGTQAWMKLAEGRKGNMKIRHTINPCGTVSGRASARHPNLQQVPRASAPYGEQCRNLFTVPDGFSLVGSDLSGIELRLLAHYLSYNDQGEYARQILEGDIHTFNQNAIGLKDHPNGRNLAKTFIYATIYGGGDKVVGEITGGGVKEGKAMKANFFNSVPAFSRLQADVQETVRRGWLKGLDGRRVTIRSAHSALNVLLQSAAGIISKKWLCLVDEEIRRQGIDAYIVAWVHDEIQIAVRQGEEDGVGDIAKRMAEKAGEIYSLRIPIDADFGKGKTWAETH